MKSRIHKLVIHVKFDKPIDKMSALYMAKDCLQADKFFPEQWGEPNLPEQFEITSVVRKMP
jgi:hypothetical protein